MRQNRRVGGRAPSGDGGQQAALEPAAVLVRPLEVEVGREGEPLFGAGLDDPGPGGARVEPGVFFSRFFVFFLKFFE